jgi:hypothetical protein
VNEQPLLFGPGKKRLGVLTLPSALNPQQPVVLIPNAGTEHRVGPARLHVELARALAAAGVATLRLDLAGLGDSDCAEPAHQETAATTDLKAAMDSLAARGLAERFVGVGLTTGAHHVHQIACKDDRLVGAIFIDGYTYRTPRYWVNYGVDRLTRSKRNAEAAERMALDSLGVDDEIAAPAPGSTVIAPTASQMKFDLQAFIARNMALYYLYTGGLQGEYNYREQLTDAFPFLRSYPRMTLRHLPDAEPGFMRRASREELIGLLVDWIVNGPQRVAPPDSRD